MPTESNFSRTKEYVKRKKISGRAFVQGLIGLGIFLASLLVVFLLYIPLIKETNGFVADRRVLELEMEDLNFKYKTISDYGSTKLTSQLSSVEYFIPDDMRVAELATFINTIAEKYNLSVTRLGISEDKTEVNKTSNEEKVKLIGTSRDIDKVYLGRIEGPFTFSGTRDDIFEFLDFLVEGGYATNFDKVNIVSQSGDSKKEDATENPDIWSVSFSTSYYYLQPIVGIDAKTPLLKIEQDFLDPISTGESASPDIIVPTEELNISVETTPTTEVTPTVSPSVVEQ